MTVSITSTSMIKAFCYSDICSLYLISDLGLKRLRRSYIGYNSHDGYNSYDGHDCYNSFDNQDSLYNPDSPNGHNKVFALLGQARNSLIFSRNFLLIILEMLFLIHGSTSLWFAERELVWRTYMTIEALLIIKQIELFKARS